MSVNLDPVGLVLVADEVNVVVVGGVGDLQASPGTCSRSWLNTSSIGPPVWSELVHGLPRIS